MEFLYFQLIFKSYIYLMNEILFQRFFFFLNFLHSLGFQYERIIKKQDYIKINIKILIFLHIYL